MSIFDTVEFNTRLFFPRRDPLPIQRRDFLWEVGVNVKVHARLHSSPEAKYTLLFFHGNGEIVSDYNHSVPNFHRLGANLIVCDYRGYGHSTGTPTLRNTLVDAEKVLQEVKNITTLPVVVMGRSLGSAAAIHLCSMDLDIAACVIESGYSCSQRLLARRGITGIDLEKEDVLFDNGEKAKKISCPTLIVHGEEDYLITPDEAQRNFNNISAEKEIALLPGAGHNDISFAKDYYPTIGKFIEKALQK